MRNKRLIRRIRAIWEDESAVAVIEVILILVIIITLVLLFKEQITTVLNNILSEITKKTQSVY